MRHPDQFELLGHDNPLGQYPGPVVPVGSIGKGLFVAYLSDNGLQFIESPQGSKYVEHSEDIASDLNSFDIRKHRLFALSANQLLYYDPARESLFFRTIQNQQEVTRASPFIRLSYAKAAQDELGIVDSLAACVDELKEDEELVESWYRKELKRLGELPLWVGSVPLPPISWVELQRFRNELQSRFMLSSPPFVLDFNLEASQPYQGITRSLESTLGIPSTPAQVGKSLRHFFRLEPEVSIESQTFRAPSSSGVLDPRAFFSPVSREAESYREFEQWLGSPYAPSTMVLVGQAGSGKTTMLNAMMHQYRNEGGAMLVVDSREALQRSPGAKPEDELAAIIARSCRRLVFGDEENDKVSADFYQWILGSDKRSEWPVSQYLELLRRKLSRSMDSTASQPEPSPIPAIIDLIQASLGLWGLLILLINFFVDRRRSDSEGQPLTVAIDNIDALSAESIKKVLNVIRPLSTNPSSRVLITVRADTLRKNENWWQSNSVYFAHHELKDSVSAVLAQQMEKVSGSQVARLEDRGGNRTQLSRWIGGFARAHLRRPSPVARTIDELCGDNIRLGLILVHSALKSLPAKSVSKRWPYGRTQDLTAQMFLQSVTDHRIINVFLPAEARHGAKLAPLRVLRHLSSVDSPQIPESEVWQLLANYGFSQASIGSTLEHLHSDQEGALVSTSGSEARGHLQSKYSTLSPGNSLKGFLDRTIGEPSYIAACAIATPISSEISKEELEKNPSLSLFAAVELLESILDQDAEQVSFLLQFHGDPKYRMILGRGLETRLIAEYMLWSVLAWKTEGADQRRDILRRIQSMINRARMLEEKLGITS